MMPASNFQEHTREHPTPRRWQDPSPHLPACLHACLTPSPAQGGLLDGEAAARCTTVYLVDRRLDMLPALLSEDLCSLRSGQGARPGRRRGGQGTGPGVGVGWGRVGWGADETLTG